MRAIEVRGLQKSYGNFQAVAGIDLHVGEGEIVAFLGPNGAGKTTTIEILEGFRKRSAGSVTVLGEDPSTASLKWREQIGIVLQESQPVPELSALESLQMQAGYYSSPLDPAELLELVGLTDSAEHRTRNLSGGQLRRLDLATALVGDPKLVFLDEPTTGFDPSARRESWGMIEALRNRGNTVLLTTHYMDEAEHLADRIIVIAAGRVVAEGTAADLAREVNAKTEISWRPRPDDPAPPPGLGSKPTGNGLLSAQVEDARADLHQITTWALAHDVQLEELSVSRPTLEDVYLLLVEQAGQR